MQDRRASVVELRSIDLNLIAVTVRAAVLQKNIIHHYQSCNIFCNKVIQYTTIVLYINCNAACFLQGVILVYDITNRWSFDGIDRWIKEIDEVKLTFTYAFICLAERKKKSMISYL